MQTITNVMEGLRNCSYINGGTKCSVCPYSKEDDCDRAVAEDAIEYLMTLRTIQEYAAPHDLNWLITKLRENRMLEGD